MTSRQRGDDDRRDAARVAGAADRPADRHRIDAGGSAAPAVDDWNLSPEQAIVLQKELRERLVLRPPAGFVARRVAGADISMSRGEDWASGGIVVLLSLIHI